MRERVAIVGVGYTPFRPLSPEVSFREMIFEAACRAYADAGLEPDRVGTVVSVTEDYLEGTSIADEYVPDQLGAVLKPVVTICQDGITGIATAYLQLATGMFDAALVEGRSKASNILHPAHIEAFAMDPVYVRPLGLNPRFVAGLEMRSFLAQTGNTEEQVAMVVAKNKANALKNPLAAYPALVTAEEVLASPPVAAPVKELDIAPFADGAVVLILARESVARTLKSQPVYIRGIGWMQDTPNLDQRDWSQAVYAELAAKMAYRQAGIRDPKEEICFAEVDDTFSYKELQHIEALGLARCGEAGMLLAEGYFLPDGPLPVNVSGGSLGNGYLYDASGLRSVLEVVLQLRGQAGERQLSDVRVGLAQSWRGIPTASGGVIILSNE